MFQLLVFACAIGAAPTLGDELVAGSTKTGSCATTLAATDHSLLQVHPASTVTSAKKSSSSGSEPMTQSGIELQQKQSILGEHEQHALEGKTRTTSGSSSETDPYPEDYDLDIDYTRDDKGTRADTIREVQSATLPGDGDKQRTTKPGLSNSWNVDTMFATDSDGGGHVSLRDMIPWGYRSQTQPKKGHTTEGTGDADKSGLLSEGKTTREEKGEHIRNRKKAIISERETAPKNPSEHVEAKRGKASGESKHGSAARH